MANLNSVIFSGIAAAAAGVPVLVSSLPLDGIATVGKFAFGMKRLKTGYAGAWARCRVAGSASAFTDIGFAANGNYDKAAAQALGASVEVLPYNQFADGFELTSAAALPIIDFTTDSVRFLDNQWLFGDLTALTAGEIVVKQLIDSDPSGAGSGGIWLMDASSLNTAAPYTDGNIYEGFGSTARKTTVNPTFNMTTAHVYGVYSAANDWANYLNGTQLFQTAGNTVGFPSAARFGRAIDSPYYLTGFVSALVLYQGKLAAGDRTSLHGVL